MSDTINPYNFIRTGKKVIRTPQSKGDLTGYLECTLKTKTPLIIPDSESVQEDSNEHKTYDYYSYGELDANGNKIPVIPGSELRGAIRSKYETLTNSCLSAIDEDVKFTGRSHCFLKNAGILNNSNGKKTLWNAQIIYIERRRGKFDAETGVLSINQHDYKMGDIIYCRSEKEQSRPYRNYITEVSPTNKQGFKEGVVFTGEKIKTDKPEKKAIQHVKVLVKKDIDEYCDNADALWNTYFRLVNEYNPANKDRFSNINEDSENIPIWFDYDEEDNYYISPSQNGRIILKNLFSNIMENGKEYSPCASRKDGLVCRTCDLFGFISDNRKITSRVRFSDAIASINNNGYCMKNLTIKELSGPKVSNFLYYFNVLRPYLSKDFYYNSDFYIESRKNDHELKYIDELEIKGRKGYWHHDWHQPSDIEKNNRNTTQNPLKEGLIFKFKVYFNNIDEKTLKELIGSIQLNDNMAHKIGHAKPLGFGSAKIEVNSVVKRNVDLENDNIYVLKKEEAPKEDIKSIFDEYITTQQYADIKAMWTYKLLDNVEYPSLIDFANNTKTLPFASDALNINNQNNSNKGNNHGNNSNFRR